MPVVSSLPREAELLLCCARIDVDPKTRDRIIALVSEGIDWDYLENLALRHRLVPLLYRNLNGICSCRPFQRIGPTSSSLSHRRLKELSGLLFEANGILAVPYKRRHTVWRRCFPNWLNGRQQVR